MRWVILFLLFAVLSLPLFSESHSVEEMTELEILTELSANLNLREKVLNERESNLNNREISLNQRENFLNLTEIFLAKRETDLNKREQSWIEINNYWKSYAEEMQKKAKGEFWKGFLFGNATGFAIGNYTGFKIGITINP